MQIIECVPNISEGKNLSKIKEIAKAFSSEPNTHILHIDSNASANRTVFTLVGEANALLNGIFSGIKKASELIDMRQHKGVHPRIGAVDVCPVIPLNNINIDETLQLVTYLSKRIANELNLPVYNYELSAKFPERRSLGNIRKGEYELLPRKLTDPKWKPDYGPNEFNSKFGVTTIGVRKLMLAYNINLNGSLEVSKIIASKIRETGDKKTPGYFKGVKAIGWYLNDINKVQVSTNIMDLDSVTPLMVFRKVKEWAKTYNSSITGSEIVGMTPAKALISKENFPSINTVLKLAIKELGLNEMYKFNMHEKILDFKLQELQLLNKNEFLH